MEKRKMIDHHKETLEQTVVAGVGLWGIIFAWVQESEGFWQAATLIVSFFGIIIPTAIWAWCRAIQSIKKLNGKGKVDEI